MTLAVTVAQGASNNVTFRNRIINGACVIDQRNAGASVGTSTTSPVYIVDRFRADYSQTSKFTAQQNAGSVTPPAGFTNYLGCTSSSAYSVGATDYFVLQQAIEGFNIADLGWGTANAKTVTLSFWVRSSLTGTFGGNVRNTDNSRCYPFSYTISSANTWEQKFITIAGDTTGTWLTNNGIGMWVAWSLGTGSTYSNTAGSWVGSLALSATGATSVVGTNGATWYITGVQLEAGTTASPFEYRQYGTELQLCQRYFEQDYDLGTPTILYGSSDGSNNAVIVYPFKVQKRGTPTMTYYNTAGTSGIWGYSRSGASGTASTNNYSINQWHFGLYMSVGASFVACNISGVWKADAEL